jgi:acetyl-CoA acetyltransferase
MCSAILVSAARPPIGRACRGAFKDMRSWALGRPVIAQAMQRAGHALLEGKRRGAQFVVVTMCAGGGIGTAGQVEVA